MIRQTSMTRINAQLRAAGRQEILAMHHEAVRFPNGHTLVLGMLERPGADGEPPMMGDMIVALDKNFQVIWTWNAFEKLDVSRRALLNENCAVSYGKTCPASMSTAHDWLHSNSIAYSPSDGNLILSVRHQDWVIKIRYQDGTGNGDVLWRLGRGGDFSVKASVLSPWFSHQHDAVYVDANKIALYDNGNVRCLVSPQGCVSRGQVFQIDEANRVATLIFNANLPGYAGAYGSAQRLANGNYLFGSSHLRPELSSSATEVTPAGAVTAHSRIGGLVYRTYRMKTLYAQ
jgi:hypothetical protein